MKKPNGKVKGLLATGVSASFIITLAIGYGNIQSTVKANEKSIVRVEKDVKETAEEIDNEENINVQQTESMKQIQKNQERFLKLFDKVNLS